MKRSAAYPLERELVYDCCVVHGIDFEDMIEIGFGVLHVTGGRMGVSARDVSVEEITVESYRAIIVADCVLRAAEGFEAISPIEVQPRLIG